MAEQSETLERGKIIAGRYQIEGILGEGGMGAVYEAIQLNLQRPIALKVLLPQYGVVAEARQRFEREARVAAALRHPNAVTIYDFGEDEGRLYLAMERLLGKTLRDEMLSIGDRGLGLGRALKVIAQICDVLIAAHQQALVHRDLKPENIFLEQGEGEERVVVVDFGLAFIEDREGVGRMTRDGILSGTPEYVSPEQVRSQLVGPPADIYSLGCVLYELVTGDVPLRGSNHFETVSHHVFTAPVPPSDLLPEGHLPQALEDLILQMLEKTPGRRPTASLAHERIRDIRRALGKRERGKNETQIEGRASRMIQKPRKLLDEETLNEEMPLEEESAAKVLLVGVVDHDLRTAMAVNGLELVEEPQAASLHLSAVFAPEAGLDLLAELRSSDLPLVTDALPADLERISALLTLGVDEVVPRPVKGEELARKVWRALRKKKRSERGSRI